MDVIIRPAEDRDLESLVRLLESLFTIEADFAFDAAKQRTGLARLIQSQQGCVWVAEHDGTVLAMVSVQIVISTAEGGPVGWVEDLIVAEDYRGRGIGRKLLRHLEAWANASGLLRLQLLADRHNHPALEFYQRLGWLDTSLIALRRFPDTPGGSDPA